MEFLQFETAAGAMAAASEEDALIRLWLPGQETPRIASHETALLRQARDELEEYLAGGRREFTVPLRPQGTEFQRRAWEALTGIPYGETRTYREIAEAVQRPKAFRAVGNALNHNPLPIFIPCHRVVGSNGSLTGYAGGLELKRRLLTLEGVRILGE